MVKNYKIDPAAQSESEKNEQNLVRKIFCIVLSHYLHTAKGGWQHLEETVNFILMHFENVGLDMHTWF